MKNPHIKIETLEALSAIRSAHCCNMLDRQCILSVLRQAEETTEVADYLENFTSEEFFDFLVNDFSDFLVA